MATITEKMQKFARYCREQEGKDLPMQEVAARAIKAGWKVPKRKTDIEILAKAFSKAEREEIRYDEVTGEPYRANVAYTQKQGNQQITFWGDTDKVSRKIMHKNYILRREQMVGDGLQLSLDIKHWNRVHPNEEPIQIELDFTDDVEWRMNAPKQSAA